MRKPAQSQCDFGELVSPESVRQVLTVSELTLKVRRLLEKQIGEVWVMGEVSNLRAQSSGHQYFSLKDPNSQLNCVLFRGVVIESRDLLEDGRKVNVQGELTVYEPRGQYQLRVLDIELQGIGALQQAFEKLKRKLSAQGWFAVERKRPLPRIPHRIGLVTSPTGAALRDILHVIRRRQPFLEILLAPCRVQGPGAAEEISRAIRQLNEWAGSPLEDRLAMSREPEPASRQACGLDLILIARGGGSLEDLWAFNEESVARAVYESRIPVVSGVGHEIDYTIADFVADVRAATPSAAAEIITEGAHASREFIRKVPRLFSQHLRHRQVQESGCWKHLTRRLARVSPRRLLNERLQRLDDLQIILLRNLQYRYRSAKSEWINLVKRWRRISPRTVVPDKRREIQRLVDRLRSEIHRQFAACRNRRDGWSTRLHLVSPQQVLARGYSITTDAATGKVLRNAQDVSPGARLLTQLQRGGLQSRVEAHESP